MVYPRHADLDSWLANLLIYYLAGHDIMKICLHFLYFVFFVAIPFQFVSIQTGMITVRGVSLSGGCVCDVTAILLFKSHNFVIRQHYNARNVRTA